MLAFLELCVRNTDQYLQCSALRCDPVWFDAVPVPVPVPHVCAHGVYAMRVRVRMMQPTKVNANNPLFQ